jgi:hypothetical protein
MARATKVLATAAGVNAKVMLAMLWTVDGHRVDQGGRSSGNNMDYGCNNGRGGLSINCLVLN